jgi:hypothetical protein
MPKRHTTPSDLVHTYIQAYTLHMTCMVQTSSRSKVFTCSVMTDAQPVYSLHIHILTTVHAVYLPPTQAGVEEHNGRKRLRAAHPPQPQQPAPPVFPACGQPPAAEGAAGQGIRMHGQVHHAGASSVQGSQSANQQEHGGAASAVRKVGEPVSSAL